jgi:hypothetical protein
MERLMRKSLSVVLVAILMLPGCAVSRASQTGAVSARSRGSTADPAVMAAYVRQLRVGSRVRLNRTNGDEIRGTLMKNDGDPLVIQRRARIPEPPIEVPLRDVVAVELDVKGNSIGRAIAIGAGAAGATVLGIFLLFAAIYSD